MSLYKWSSTAAANATADGSINWAEGMAPSAVNDSARGMMAATAKFRNDISGVTTGGSSTAYTITSNQNFDTLAHLSGNIICIIPHTTSGAAPTLNVDGLGAFAINKATTVAVATGALVAGTPYLLVYANATTEFLLTDVFGVVMGTLGAGAVVTSSFTAGAVDSNALGSGAVVTAKIANSAVTYATIQNVAISKLLGNPSSTASAAPSEIAIGPTLSMSAGTLAATGPVLLNTLTGATLTDTSSFTSTYDRYLIVLEGILPSASGNNCRLRINSGGVQSTSYTYAGIGNSINGTINAGTSVGTFIPCDDTQGVASAGQGIFGEIVIHNVSGSSVPKMIRVNAAHQASANTFGMMSLAGYWGGGNGSVTGIEISMSAGSIVSGSAKVYGIT